MKITEELVKILKELKEYCSSQEFDVNEFTLMLKEYEREYNIKSNEILELLYNKEILVRKVSCETKTIDAEIKKLKKQISVLENQKFQYGSLICELHGHNLDSLWPDEGHSWFCSNCGKKVYLKGHEANNYLRQEEQSNSKIYKYQKDN